jgi:molybdopterin synthase catalytic subunit
MRLRPSSRLTLDGAAPDAEIPLVRQHNVKTMIRVQREDFDPGGELAALTAGRCDIGGAVSFVGLVRDRAAGEPIGAMTLEHYPGMTEKRLAEIEAEALRRWPLSASLIVHRYGRLAPGERIVLVITASAHRQAAFEANMFLVDWLKTKAPFWKLEERRDGAEWVEAQASDDDAAARWQSSPAKAAE